MIFMQPAQMAQITQQIALNKSHFTWWGYFNKSAEPSEPSETSVTILGFREAGMSDISFWAQKFLCSGIAVFPIKYRDKRPDFRLLPTDNTGHPTWEPFKSILPDTEQVQRWFDHGLHNYAVVTAWQNLVVLDFDDTEQYTRWLLWAARQDGLARSVAQHAFRVATSRGVHVYLRTLQPEKRNKKLRKVDIKAQGYVLGPGSVHPSGAVYTPLLDAWHFPVISALSDVLPVDLLLQHTEHIPGVALPPVAAPSIDPWQVASQPRSFSGGLVERILKQLRIEDFFPDRQRTSGDGRWWMTRCPLHDDQRPSMWIDTRNQICGCYAGCTEKPLDAINLFARLNGLSNSNAIFALGGAGGVE